MDTWIALFRGINVGGRNVLPMRDLKSLLEARGCTDISTYIQSGNVVFRHLESDRGLLSQEIRRAVNDQAGFAPDVLLLTEDELRSAIAGNPFPGAESDHKSLHVFFLARSPTTPDLEAMDANADNGESYALDGRLYYLHAPAGIGRSRLAGRVEKLLGVPATARNWRTVCRLLELCRACAR